jgi:hypothetical protein
MPPPPSLTPAQLALQAERRALKEAKKATAQAQAKENAGPIAVVQSDSDKAKFLRRDWVTRAKRDSTRSLRIVTWNVCQYGRDSGLTVATGADACPYVAFLAPAAHCRT